jgi:hypothetical protein
MRHAIACRIGLALAMAAALGLASATACAEESPPAAAPAAAAPAPQGEARPADTKPPESPPAEAKPPKPPAEGVTAEVKPPKLPTKKFLTEEEVRQLPVFTRLDDASFQEILAKGKTLLADVKDNTFGYDEEAFYWLLHLVSRLKPELLKPDAESLPYSALLTKPSLYRGELVTISGVYESVEKHHVPALALQKDVPYMYPCVISDHQNPMLATVIVLQDPSLYLRVRDDVVVKGYFYKVRQYQSRGGNENSAPMIIAQRLVPAGDAATDRVSASRAPEPGLGGMLSDPTLVVMIAVIILLMIGFFALRMQLRKPKPYGTDKRKPQVHKFRLRRPDRIEPPAGGRPGNEGGGPKP